MYQLFKAYVSTTLKAIILKGIQFMNAEIANRLYQYRKHNNLSQEELADKLGISRQAISKWERAEASPDTDNLINLAKLYGVSLDDLISTTPTQNNDANSKDKTDNQKTTDAQNNNEETEDKTKNENSKSKTNINIAKDGIHIEDDDDTVHIGFKGIHIEDKDDTVHIGLNGIHVQDKDGSTIHYGKDSKKQYKKEHNWEFNNMKPKWADIPLGVIAVVAYMLMGSIWGYWNHGWIVFFIVPIGNGFIDAIRKHRTKDIPINTMAVAIFLLLGTVWGYWNPGWIIFLTIPIFKWLVK